VLSGRGLCDELITRPEESYRLCCVVVCDLETSRIGAPYIHNVGLLRVKTHCYEVGWTGVDWVDMPQNWDRWQAVVNTVMNIKCGAFLDWLKNC